MRIDGTALAKKRELSLQRSVSELASPPRLALLGFGHASVHSFSALKQRAAERVGVLTELHTLGRPTTNQLVDTIKGLNARPEVDGIFVPYPLPQGVDARLCLDAIVVRKDVDGASQVSLDALAESRSCFAPASAVAVRELLLEHGVEFRSASVLIVHDGTPFALPLAWLLRRAGAAVELRFFRELDRADLTRADVIIACGPPKSIRVDDLSSTAIVIDACYGQSHGALTSEDTTRIAAYAPSRGAVGPMTVSVLLEHTIRAARANLTRAGQEPIID